MFSLDKTIKGSLDVDIHSEEKKLHKLNYLKFRARLQSSIGSDVHREFTGYYWPQYRTLSMEEIREVRGKVVLVKTFEEDLYLQPNNDFYLVDDFEVGNNLALGPTKNQRECDVVKTFVICDVDKSNLKTTNEMLRGPLGGHAEPVASPAPQRPIPPTTSAALAKAQASLRSPDAVIILKRLGSRFSFLDEDGHRKIPFPDLKVALAELQLSAGEAMALLQALPTASDGYVRYHDFLDVLRGPMSERRQQCIAKAFRKMDYQRRGILVLDDIRMFYHEQFDPSATGEEAPGEIIKRLLETFDTRKHNGVVTYAEFEDYYYGVSAYLDDEESFIQLMDRTWNLDGRNSRTIAFH